METASPHLAERLRAIGISESYASQLANGRRTPSLALALRIYAEIQVRLGALDGASEAEIAALSRVARRNEQIPQQGQAA